MLTNDKEDSYWTIIHNFGKVKLEDAKYSVKGFGFENAKYMAIQIQNL
jgi:hypothetical protein